MKHNQDETVVKDLENFLNSYATMAEDYHSLPVALWTIATHAFPSFDCFPYLVITAMTKRSGKSRLMELITFAASNPRSFSAMTAPTLFRSIEAETPSIFFDEAEVLNNEAASTMRAVLNVGYRKGQTIPRIVGDTVKEFQTYCPKCFVLIGDVYDTLRDRSIIVMMKRAEPKKRFVFDTVKSEGANLRKQIAELIEEKSGEITAAYSSFSGLKFLTDRDEEIWSPLFVLCKILCPSRLDELTKAAVDMSTEKTSEARSYAQSYASENAAEYDEYSIRLLNDMLTVIGKGKAVKTSDALEALKALPTSPWRKFKGEGITMHSLSAMLSTFGVTPKTIRFGSGRSAPCAKGYEKEMIAKAIKKVGK